MTEQAVVKVLPSADGVRRVLITKRAGYYALRSERRYSSTYEGKLIAEGWAEIPSSASYYADPDIAEREAFLEFPCLRTSAI